MIFPAFKAVPSTLHVTAPKRSTAKIACIYAASGDSFHAAPRTTARQNEKPTDTTVALLCYAKQGLPECGKGWADSLFCRVHIVSFRIPHYIFSGPVCAERFHELQGLFKLVAVCYVFEFAVLKLLEHTIHSTSASLLLG